MLLHNKNKRKHTKTNFCSLATRWVPSPQLNRYLNAKQKITNKQYKHSWLPNPNTLFIFVQFYWHTTMATYHSFRIQYAWEISHTKKETVAETESTAIHRQQCVTSNKLRTVDMWILHWVKEPIRLRVWVRIRFVHFNICILTPNLGSAEPQICSLLYQWPDRATVSTSGSKVHNCSLVILYNLYNNNLLEELTDKPICRQSSRRQVNLQTIPLADWMI